MPPKKRKLAEGQQTLSKMFAQKSTVNVATEESTGDARETESKQHFLINLMIVQDEIECGIDFTLSYDFDSHFIPGTSSNRIASENEVEIECAGSSASTSRASASTQQSEWKDFDSGDSDDDDTANETLNFDFDFESF